MKVTREELDALQTMISPLDTPERRARYASGDFPRADRTKDLSKRYRWDLFHHARRLVGFDAFDFMSNYTNDQIDTALRRIVTSEVTE